jgi:hypothetical protein
MRKKFFVGLFLLAVQTEHLAAAEENVCPPAPSGVQWMNVEVFQQTNRGDIMRPSGAVCYYRDVSNARSETGIEYKASDNDMAKDPTEKFYPAKLVHWKKSRIGMFIWRYTCDSSIENCAWIGDQVLMNCGGDFCDSILDPSDAQ